ncbi:hypothetical protein [Marinicrinis sediminis]|uniref:Uncharacterized protein n=1 Tax=Marinicrinis sediminis TaxID=1652465 RepID=A0ABW5RBJ5_9BACL
MDGLFILVIIAFVIFYQLSKKNENRPGNRRPTLPPIFSPHSNQPEREDRDGKRSLGDWREQREERNQREQPGMWETDTTTYARDNDKRDTRDSWDTRDTRDTRDMRDSRDNQARGYSSSYERTTFDRSSASREPSPVRQEEIGDVVLLQGSISSSPRIYEGVTQSEIGKRTSSSLTSSQRAGLRNAMNVDPAQGMMWAEIFAAPRSRRPYQARGLTVQQVPSKGHQES